MSRFSLLIFGCLFATASFAEPASTVRARGRVRIIDQHAYLIVYGGSLGEIKLRLRPDPATNPSELTLHLLALADRDVTVKGSGWVDRRRREGEVTTDLTRVRLILPDPRGPGGGDQLIVDPAITPE